jgi:N6-L-threonylcarbamoyladenine synthase
MYVLGIETTCDETAAALLEFADDGKARVVSEEISSQSEVHEQYGGVVPELASREHLTNLPLVLESVMRRASLELSDCSCIGVTQGPGLKGCVLMGFGFARALALATGVPIVGVNHIEGHVFAPCLDNPELETPFLSMVVSGGHTEIHEVHAIGDYRLVARTMDDAAGEAFDKSANLLGFNYPGGPKLAALADTSSDMGFKLPKVMRESEGFSFSGLKTAISLLISRNKIELEKDPELKGGIAWAIQNAIVDTLCHKLQEAVRRTGIRRVSVTGGVSANRCLRARVQALPGVKAFFPLPAHSVDNAAMIAYVAGLRFQNGERMDMRSEVYSRWPLEEMNRR